MRPAQVHAQGRSPRISAPFSIFRTFDDAPDRAIVEASVASGAAKRAPTASRLSAWKEENIPEGLTVFDFPREHWRRLRTTNNLERLNKEIKRRTNVVGLFPDEPSVIRLVGSALMETRHG